MRRAAFVFLAALALCAGAYTRGDGQAIKSAGGGVAPPACADAPDADFVKLHDKGGVLCGNDFSPVGVNGEKCGVSGVALLGQTADGAVKLLVVHDAKADGGAGKRLGVVTLDSRGAGNVNYSPLDWPKQGAPPDDLEAVTSVPGEEGLFLAVTSKGRVFGLTVAGEKVTPRPGFELPDLLKEEEVEGLSVQRLKGGRLVIAWGYRGAGRRSGVLAYGLLDLERLLGEGPKRPEEIVTGRDRAAVEVQYPWPEDPNTRHIADLKIDEGGNVWAAAAYDPNDTVGPFVSAVYRLGRLDASRTPVRFERDEDLPLVRTFRRKIEGLELLPGGVFVFGAEDELRGGWLLKWRRKAVRGGPPKR
jgi:hypothetical protein